MIRFSKEKVLLLHKIITESTGGSMGIRDEALLESALESAFSGCPLRTGQCHMKSCSAG